MNNSTLDKESYKKMVDLTSQILCIFYFKGKIKYANPAFTNVFGYSNDEIEELNVFSIIHPDDKSSLNNALVLADKERQEVVNLEFRFRCKDDNFKWISWKVRFEWDEELFYGAGSDIFPTTFHNFSKIPDSLKETVFYEKILQTQFDLLHKTIDTLDLPFIRLSYPGFSITDMNQKALNIIEGLKPEMNSIDIVKGQKYTDIITGFDKEDMFKHFQMIKDKKETSYKKYKELIVFGKKIFVNVLYQPIIRLEGDIQQVIAIIIDVTKETRAKLELEKNLRMQEEFFLNISHELKTPLNVIFSITQLFDLYIKDGSLIENENKLKKYINVITQNCCRQSKLVNNLIDLSKIQSGFFKLHLSNQNIISVVEDIVQSVSEYVENKGLKIVFDTNIEEKIIACDPINIERVMLNLISNAIKFSMAGDGILVDVLDKGEWVEISVIDTGIGIDKDYLDVIFERFKQVDTSLSRNAEGSGIGLCIVKSIVELHGGRINLKSEKGKGSKFTIEFPNRTVEVPYRRSENNMVRSKIETINIEFSDIYS